MHEYRAVKIVCPSDHGFCFCAVPVVCFLKCHASREIIEVSFLPKSQMFFVFEDSGGIHDTKQEALEYLFVRHTINADLVCIVEAISYEFFVRVPDSVDSCETKGDPPVVNDNAIREGEKVDDHVFSGKTGTSSDAIVKIKGLKRLVDEFYVLTLS